MDFFINTDPDYWKVPLSGLLSLEERRNAKYVCETCIQSSVPMDKTQVMKPGWINHPVLVFYTPVAHPEGSNWFGIYFTAAGQGMICNAASAVEHDIQGVVAANGEIIYSKYRHDYRMSSDGTAMADGGRDYFKTGPIGQGFITLRIEEDKLIWKDFTPHEDNLNKQLRNKHKQLRGKPR
jgi:hypothetical protein